MDSLKALDIISKIELTHMEYDTDDVYYDDEEELDTWTYEQDDGTIEENYPDEVKTIQKDLRVLSILRRIIPVNMTDYSYDEKGTLIPHYELPREFKELTTEAEWKEITRWLNEK